ncbi:hypothetical protein [[Acidovorax] ebreus]|uniref:Uncharacterized protein n=1 Tax=Acidovorax ebreus (strain TPSY) TaxID=535289 RepID=A0A9J9QBN1_ACIET|nr:hypothetical protein [[Acidovorax] ebreus]ACM32313.1 hypothetical protein Dtpsy_0835 [[Acidovorax] ebreus TPSY]
MPHSPITAGTKVVYQEGVYTVRAVDGNVLELAYHTGDFFRLVHASSVLVCPPPATQTAASLPAPVAGQGAGTPSAFLAWECVDGPDPLPRWERHCGSRSEVLIGASFALLLDPWGNV